MADALPSKINLTVVTRERNIIDIGVDEDPRWRHQGDLNAPKQ